MNKSSLSLVNPQEHSTMLMSKDSTSSEDGLINGSMICGCYQLEVSLDLLMLLKASDLRLDPSQERLNYQSMVLDLKKAMDKLQSDSSEERPPSMQLESSRMKISSNAKLLLLTNPKNAKFESHAVNTILPLPLLISPISSTLKLTKQSPTDLVFSNKTTLMLKLCFSFKPVTLKDKIVLLVVMNSRSRSKDWTFLSLKSKLWMISKRKLLMPCLKRIEKLSWIRRLLKRRHFSIESILLLRLSIMKMEHIW